MTVLAWFQKLFRNPPERPGISYTPRAAALLNIATEEAAKHGSRLASADDVVAAFLSINKGIAADVLKRFEINAEVIRTFAVEPGAKQTIETLLPIAQREMRKFGHHYLGTEHLLLALLQVSSCQLRSALTSKGISARMVRQAVLQELDPNFIPEESTDSPTADPLR